jgi:hypothetical protein
MKWLPIADFPNYEISDSGLVRRIDTKKEIAQNTKRGKHPYKRVHLSHEGVSKYLLVHRLVLTAFVGPCPKGEQALHKDDNPANNALDNLMWGTPKRNHETINRRGERNGRAKLTEDDVLTIRSSSCSTSELAQTYGVSQKYIQNILRRIVWQHIPQN